MVKEVKYHNIILKFTLVLLLVIISFVFTGCNDSTTIPNKPDIGEDASDGDITPDYKEDIPVVKEETEKDIAVKRYLEMIYVESVKKVWFSTYSDITQYYGYIFLYQGQTITPKEEIVNKAYTSTRPQIKRGKIEYIVIHDTGNNASSANAKMHSKYINSNPGVSWHYTVDEKEIYHHIPNDEVSYHAGDGLRDYGSTYYNQTYKTTSITGGNKNGIGIETCVNKGSDYTTTLFNTAELVSELMINYSLSINQVKKHYDFSGKICPQALIQSGNWNEFIKYVNICYYYKTNLSDVKITFKSESKYMDNRGRISLNVPKNEEIKYSVTCEYDNKTVKYEYVTRVK